jgi:hypothetical protein
LLKFLRAFPEKVWRVRLEMLDCANLHALAVMEANLYVVYFVLRKEIANLLPSPFPEDFGTQSYFQRLLRRLTTTRHANKGHPKPDVDLDNVVKRFKDLRPAGWEDVDLTGLSKTGQYIAAELAVITENHATVHLGKRIRGYFKGWSTALLTSSRFGSVCIYLFIYLL